MSWFGGIGKHMGNIYRDGHQIETSWDPLNPKPSDTKRGEELHLQQGSDGQPSNWQSFRLDGAGECHRNLPRAFQKIFLAKVKDVQVD